MSARYGVSPGRYSDGLVHVWKLRGEVSGKTGFVDGVAMCREYRQHVVRVRPRFVREVRYTASIDLLELGDVPRVCRPCRESAIRVVNAVG